MEWEQIVSAIEGVVSQIRKDYAIENAIIRDDVFDILEKNCTVLYYPISDKRNCGFHIKRIVKNELEDFVYINTQKPLEMQVFTAAHELGHIWHVADKVSGMLQGEEIYGDSFSSEMEESITNRFAAELLMPKEVFIRTFYKRIEEIHVYNGVIRADDLARIIALQMSDYLVPYKAVRKRLFETNITNDVVNNYLKDHQESFVSRIRVFAKDQNLRLETERAVKTIPGIGDLLENSEKCQNADPFLLEKIRKDFEIKNKTTKDDTKDDIIEIQLWESSNGQNGSIS